MCNKVVALGLSVLGIAGCTGSSSDTWLSAANVELYENHQGAAYRAIFSSSAHANTQYSISGDDAPLFLINAQSGEIYFQQSPDYEDPQDYTLDNSYAITVMASDSVSGEQVSKLNVSIHVKDAEQLQATQYFPLPNSYVEPNQNGAVPLTLTVDDPQAPVYFPNDWQVADQNVTRFFHYPSPFFVFETQFSEDGLTAFLDPKQFDSADSALMQFYYERKYLPTSNKPDFLHYGFTVNSTKNITIAYTNTAQEQIPPVELEWQLTGQFSELGTDFTGQSLQIELSDNRVFIASDNALWQMKRDGSHLSQVFRSEILTVEKIAVINQRVFVLLHLIDSQRWLLTELNDSGELVNLYGVDSLSNEMLGADYDVEIIRIESEYTAAFLPKDLCRANNEGVIASTMYRFDSMGLRVDNKLLSSVDKTLFDCQDGQLVDHKLTYDLVYGSPKMSYNPKENFLYYWGRRFSEDHINGFTLSGSTEAPVMGTEYMRDEMADYISEFQHFVRSFNERKSMYIYDAGIYVANGHIDAEAIRISNENYRVLNYAVDESTDLIYSVGYWNSTQTLTLAVHHLNSGATSYVPLNLDNH